MSSPPSSQQDSFSLYAKPTSKSLFSESPLLSLGSKTGPGGDDLSLSELSVNETPQKPTSFSNQEPPRFSLFGVADSPQKGGDDSYYAEDDEQVSRRDGDENDVVEGESRISRRSAVEDQSILDDLDSQSPPTTPKASKGDGETEQAARPTRRTREEELQTTLYQMRSINSVLLEYLDALSETERNNRILAQQVDNSHQLLNKYTALLGQTEHTARLLLDPQWQGAEADEALAAEQARQEALEQERREREERERLERQEREAAERAAQEEREREARERASKVSERGKPGIGRARGRGTTTRGTVPFPAGYAATIHFQWPGKPFQLLGMVSNEKPSAIFRLRGAGADNQSTAGMPMPTEDITATLGISIEPVDVVQAQVAAARSSAPSAQQPPGNTNLADPVVLAERIVKHLFNHLSSFEMQVGPQTVVPLGVIQRWYEALVHKLKAGGAGFLMND
ncbi:hypothetical protein FS837_008490 [Tulasnella sp. UAMH 9824]|nr:hypothetical protein FS837_008490 [Tulasnella sp. UAMH 9824]